MRWRGAPLTVFLLYPFPATFVDPDGVVDGDLPVESSRQTSLADVFVGHQPLDHLVVELQASVQDVLHAVLHSVHLAHVALVEARN